MVAVEPEIVHESVGQKIVVPPSFSGVRFRDVSGFSEMASVCAVAGSDGQDQVPTKAFPAPAVVLLPHASRDATGRPARKSAQNSPLFREGSFKVRTT
jgi:hypothetical protein